jgi:hypothetical protein
MLLVFMMSAAVQVNDPDPWLWIGLYTVAAGATFLTLLRLNRWWIPAALAGLTIAWAATIAPRVLGRVQFGEMFGAWEMRDLGIEQSREMYGLLIVAVWMLVLTVRTWRSSAQRA